VGLPGLAKAAFLKEYQYIPWKKEPLISNWPLLDAFLVQQRISYLDYILTQHLLHKHPDAPQEAAFFLCHLIMAAREGHLCVQVKDNCLFPNVGQIWQKEMPLSSEEAKLLHFWILRGSVLIPSALLTQSSQGDIACSTPVCHYLNCFYLQRHWVFETLFLKHLKQQMQDVPNIALDPIKIGTCLDLMCQKNALLPEQAAAIKNACLHPFSIITGGPGTGKTYTAGQLIRVICENVLDQDNYRIVLTAPTGKAVANLQKNLNFSEEQFPGCSVVAKTLHALLGINSLQFKESTPRLVADLVIVDESSMIDVQLMARLFESVARGTRVILLGDRHQLPSVEAGSIFADLIDVACEQKMIPHTHLQKCMRAELQAIVHFAALINEGQAERALKAFDDSNFNGIERIVFDGDKKEALKAFLEHVKGYFPGWMKHPSDPKKHLELFAKARILSPMRKGFFGVEDLNALLWSYFSQDREGWLAVPIMITINDYRYGLFNGETGTLMCKLPIHASADGNYAIFPSRDDEQEVRTIPAALLPRYEHAYCLSVHKSQGSEFDHIILVMPEGSELFGREVFYTAVTRARKKVEIYGSDSVLQQTIARKASRLSGISQRLHSLQ
jgi:exodeoxyribonuclease V alpha subunit